MPGLMQNRSNVSTTTATAQGGRLVAVDGKSLPLLSVNLEARAAGGIARTVLRQTFANPHAEPLEAVYLFPLPAGGAAAAYEIRIGDRTILGEVDRRAKARERYDRALIEGRTAGLVDHERPNLFTQRVGNIPPGAEIEVVLTIDQPLHWVEGGWEWRFPTVVAPRYLGDEGRVPDAERVAVDVADGDTGVRASFVLEIFDAIVAGQPGCLSHPARIDDRLPGHQAVVPDRAGDDEFPERHAVIPDRADDELPEPQAGVPDRAGDDELHGHRGGVPDRVTTVSLDGPGARLDRDVVVRWPVALPDAGIGLCRSRAAEGRTAASAFGLLTLVPPAVASATLPRDLIALIDTSGSMSGAPLRHAREVLQALVGSLDDADRFELVAFSSQPRRWQRNPCLATEKNRAEALAWIEALEAGGGTEMVSAIAEALRPLRVDAQRQVVLITDGEIGFEAQVIGAIVKDLPPGSRLHGVAIGSAANQDFLRSAARAGRGIHVVVGLDEGPAAGAVRLVAATRGPAVIDLEISGSAVVDRAPARPGDLLAGAPALVGLRLAPEGGDLVVRGRTVEGAWERRLHVPATAEGAGNPAVRALYARERVNDLEMELAGGAERRSVDARIEQVGLEFGIATRLTSWVAVDSTPSVDPRQPLRVERVPQDLPFGLSAEGLGLARAAAGPLRMEAAFLHADDRLAYEGSTPFLERAFESARFREPERPLFGRIVAAPDQATVIVEFEVDRPLDWAIPQAVEALILGAHRHIEIEVVEKLTTTATLVIPGMRVRLGLRIDPAMAEGLVSLRVLTPDGEIEILLARAHRVG